MNRLQYSYFRRQMQQKYRSHDTNHGLAILAAAMLAVVIFAHMATRPALDMHAEENSKSFSGFTLTNVSGSLRR